MSEKNKAGSSSEIKMQKAFFELLESTDYRKISVSALIEKAGVSRTTFYRHYVDILDMYDKTCSEMLRNFISELGESFINKSPDFDNLFEDFCRKLSTQKKYILLLCGKNGNRKFFEFALKAIVDYAENVTSLSEEDLFLLKFVVYSGIGTYVKSIIDGIDYPPEYMKISKDFLNIAKNLEVH